MPSWVEWTIIGVGGAIGLYILFFVIVLLTISKFNKLLNKRREAMRLLLAQRKDITIALYKLAIAQKAKASTLFQNEMTALTNTEIGLLNSSEIFDFAPKLEKMTKAVFEFAETSKTIKKMSEYAQYKKELEELDEIKRQHIAIYNSDINGYNYWIRIMSYRWILIALKFHEKKRIE
ncbi:MAG: hypothetical protein WC282_01890 [Bacilli bacterium]|jgi:hypothetical protein